MWTCFCSRSQVFIESDFLAMWFLYPNLWLVCRPDGEEEQLALLVALAEDGLDPVDALAQLGRHVGLRLLRVVDEGPLAAGDARAQAVDEGGRPPPRLGRRQRLDHVRRDRRQRFWRKRERVHTS